RVKSIEAFERIQVLPHPIGGPDRVDGKPNGAQALLLDQEATWRNNKRLALRLRNTKLHHPAVPEDIIRRAPREYDRSILDLLIAGDWIRKHENCAIVGPTGIGKSWLACALGHKACRDNHSVLYVRMPALLQSLEQARGIGSLAARLKSLGAVELIILDDYGLQYRRQCSPLSAGDPRGTIRPTVDARHQPIPRSQMARKNQRPHLRRRNIGSSCSQRSQA
ncbi:IstB-like ATP binding protein, partial [Mesorhizobium loti]